ncbi:hypothetical protein ACFWPQ_30660 [Streptomyces sp. NPDC058464]
MSLGEAISLRLLVAVVWQGHSTEFLGQVSTTVAASAVAPALLYTVH